MVFGLDVYVVSYGNDQFLCYCLLMICIFVVTDVALPFLSLQLIIVGVAILAVK